MAGVYDLRINQGETFKRTIGIKQSNGEPLRLYGYTVRCHIRRSAQGGIVLAVPIKITNEANGEIALEITAKQTSLILTSGDSYANTEKYVYDVEIAIMSGEVEHVERILNGDVIVSPEVTR